MPRNRFVRLALTPLVLAGTLGLAACGSSGGTPAEQPTATTVAAMADGDKMTDTTVAMSDDTKAGGQMAEPSTTVKP